MLRWLRSWGAHLLTGVRLVVAPLIAESIFAGSFHRAAVLFAIAAATDVVDGWAARRLTTASESGRWFDHLADIAFLLAGFGALAAIGEVPLFVPVSIATAFAFYVADSMRRSATRSLIGSRLGHLSGVLNYGILGGVVFDAALGGQLVPDRVRALALIAVPIYSAAAIAVRLLAPSTKVGGPA